MSVKPARQLSSRETATPAVFTKAAAYRLYQTLGQLKGVVAEPQHLYALVRLRKALQPEAETIEELNKLPERIQELEAKRLQLCQSFASKDANGNPLISSDKNFVIPAERRPEFEAAIKHLQDDNRKDLESHQQSIQKINAIAKEPSEVQQLPRIPVSALTGGLTLDQIEVLYPILVDENCAPH